jgi:hypothetical protein
MCVLVMGFALAMVPLLMFPILKKHNEPLALGYVVFRGGLETVMYLVSAASMLVLVPLSQAYARAGAAEASGFQAAGELILSVTRLPLTTLVFCLGALIFYTVLFRSNLIPRWLSAWGLISILPYLAAALLPTLGIGDESSSWIMPLYMPMMLQEMVMAVWMIVKGFSPAAPVRMAVQKLEMSY